MEVITIKWNMHSIILLAVTRSGDTKVNIPGRMVGEGISAHVGKYTTYANSVKDSTEKPCSCRFDPYLRFVF
jgi:hypothetical protein